MSALQLPINFTKAVHVREHTQETEDHLNKNRRKFTGDVAIVLSLLERGEYLTTWRAYDRYQISCLPTRIWDIENADPDPGKERIHVSRAWALDPDTGNTKNKVYFLEEFRQKFEINGWIKPAKKEVPK
jgi:hypothetical protein